MTTKRFTLQTANGHDKLRLDCEWEQLDHGETKLNFEAGGVIQAEEVLQIPAGHGARIPLAEFGTFVIEGFERKRPSLTIDAIDLNATQDRFRKPLRIILPIVGGVISITLTLLLHQIAFLIGIPIFVLYGVLFPKATFATLGAMILYVYFAFLSIELRYAGVANSHVEIAAFSVLTGAYLMALAWLIRDQVRRVSAIKAIRHRIARVASPLS
ncbi:MAG: hypothetical protein KDB07_07635 [Planctomycetes bacterium]|nr:hypothetical protein [Planctomycetota bacterium]